MTAGVPESLLREGETLEVNQDYRVGIPSQNFAVFRIGLIKDGSEKYVRVKLSEFMWQATMIEAKMVIAGDRVAAILLRIAASESHGPDIFAVSQPNNSRKDKPYFDMPVGKKSKMLGNRYPKSASSMKQGDWWRVDIPGSVDLKINNSNLTS